ncbi:ATP-binding protein [Candidatus Micrarchaeota archaeon]|nr:ATP-binding protein [Candidatus Micrarchaeota archaeon]
MNNFGVNSIDAVEFVKYSKIGYEKTSKDYVEYKKRFFYDMFNKRLNIMYGIRGSGKTTIMFQKYNESDESKRVYIHGEEISTVKLPLLSVLKAVQYLFGDDAIVFIDEINAYPNWWDEIKVAYDKYTKMKFYITGSSSLNIKESKQKLARRANYVHLPPLLFREYIFIRTGVKLERFNPGEDLLRSAMRYDIYIHDKVSNLLNIVDDYINNNLPYLFDNSPKTLKDLVEKVIYSDIAKSRNLETYTLNKFERMILLLSASNKINYTVLSNDLGVSKSMVGSMLNLLERGEIIKRVLPYKMGKSSARKEWKYYFIVPSIRKEYADMMLIPESETVGNMTEDIFASNFTNVYFLDNIDFVWKDYLIEIGSKKKGFQQFNNIKTKFKKIIVYKGLDISEKDGVYKLPFYIFYSIL